MNTVQTPPHVEMMKFILGKWISKPIYVAAKLKLADHLSDGPKSCEVLARRVNAQAPMLYRLMRALASVGIFAETDDARFELTPMGACLKSDALRPVALMMGAAWHDQAWNRLLQSVQTGEIAFDRAHGMPIVDWLRENPAAASAYDQANAIKARTSHRAIVDAYDFSGLRSLTDIGGGTGALMVEILRANPTLNGIVADTPRVVPRARAYIRSNGLASRCAVAACDMFDRIPAGSDACLLSHILHDWEDKPCHVILSKIREALPTAGRLLVVEALIAPANQFSMAKLLDLEVLVMGGGKERTQVQYRDLLQSSGFELTRVISTQESISILEALPLT